MSLKALIFDVDGTLADTEKDGHRVAYNRAFKQLGIDWYWSEAVYGELLAVTGGKERMKYFVANYGPALPHSTAVPELIVNIYQTKTKIFNDMLLSGSIQLRSGIERLFNEAREAGLRLAIATTTAPSNVEYLLTSNLGKQSLNWFEVIAAGDIVENKKPSPEIYQLVLDEMNLRADECLAFEDSENGCQSAIGAGLRVIITVSSYTADEHFSGAEMVLDKLGEDDDKAMVITAGERGFREPMLTVDYLLREYAK